MTIRHLTAAMAFAASLACSSASAWDQNPFDLYLQRRDTVTLGAGNAKAVNSATHMINPWPPYVMDRRIPGNGERMVGAVERYRDTAKIPRVPCPMIPQFDIQSSGIRIGPVQCGAGQPVVGTRELTTGIGTGSTTRSTVPMFGP